MKVWISGFLFRILSNLGTSTMENGYGEVEPQNDFWEVESYYCNFKTIERQVRWFESRNAHGSGKIQTNGTPKNARALNRESELSPFSRLENRF